MGKPKPLLGLSRPVWRFVVCSMNPKVSNAKLTTASVHSQRFRNALSCANPLLMGSRSSAALATRLFGESFQKRRAMAYPCGLPGVLSFPRHDGLGLCGFGGRRARFLLFCG